MAANHTTITGPKTKPMSCVPRRCTKKSATRMAMVIGTIDDASVGALALRPSTALSTEMAGVTTPSP